MNYTVNQSSPSCNEGTRGLNLDIQILQYTRSILHACETTFYGFRGFAESIVGIFFRLEERRMLKGTNPYKICSTQVGTNYVFG